MKSSSIFIFGDKIYVGVHKLFHLTSIKYGEHVFKNYELLHKMFSFPFLVSGSVI